MDWWVQNALDNGGAPFLVSWIVWVIGSIILHELAHGWAALWEGDRTPIELGHMTWNPVVHMGTTSLIMFAVFGIAWGAMPVSPYRFRHRHGDAIVAFAGPAMNLGLMLIAIIGGAVMLRFEAAIGEPLATNLLNFFYLGAMLNVLLALFNLLPIPPLDGSRILSSFQPSYERLWQSENAQWFGFGLFLLVFFFGAAYLFGIADLIAGMSINYGGKLLGAGSSGASP